MTALKTSWQEKRRAREAVKAEAESRNMLAALRDRADWRPELNYFVELWADSSPAAVARRTGRPVLRLMCVQAPLEMVWAAGFQPYRIHSGSAAEVGAAPPGAPALMCPVIKALLGAAGLREDERLAALVLPTTCDWVVKWPEALRAAGLALPQLHYLELPHLKETESGRKHWLDEIWNFKIFLEKLSHRLIDGRALLKALVIYDLARAAREKLRAARRAGRLAGVWFLLIMNSFFLDTAAAWTEKVEKLAQALPVAPQEPPARVFLAGSPVFFPNFKLPLLLEEAGLAVTADDLCSSERLFPDGVAADDPSTFGLAASLAGRYHQGCLCPTFADNDRRVNNILARLAEGGFQGVVFQVLKGCHPYDLESWTLEAPLKAAGLKFLRLETDYAAEDSRNLLTRLAAFRRTLEDI